MFWLALKMFVCFFSSETGYSLILLGSFVLGVSGLNEPVTFPNQPLGVNNELRSQRIYKNFSLLGHPNKMFCFSSPTHFFRKVKKKKKKIPDTLVKEANTSIYKHTILFY